MTDLPPIYPCDLYRAASIMRGTADDFARAAIGSPTAVKDILRNESLTLRALADALEAHASNRTEWLATEDTDDDDVPGCE